MNEQRQQGRGGPWAIGAAYGFYYMAYTASFSFMAVFLKSRSITDAQVGIIYSLMAAVSLVAQPLLGYLADSKIPIKWIVLALMGGAIPVGFLVPLAASSFPLAAAAVLALAFFDQSLVTLLDSWTTQAAEKNARIVYSVARGTGAFTCAVAGFLVGRAISAWGEGTIFWLHAAFMAPALVAAGLFASVPCKNRAGQRQEEGEGHYTFWQAGKALLKNRAFALLMGGLLLLNIGNRAVVTYLPMLISQFGGTAGDQGMAVTMMSVGVFPFMLLYPKLEKRFSNKKVLFFACVLVVGRSLSFALAGSLQMAIYMQLLEAAALGLYNPALIRYTASVTPQRLRSSAIALSAAVQVAVCGIVGNALASLFLAYASLRVMFVVYTALAAAGLCLVGFSLRQKPAASSPGEGPAGA
ncbi:MFS transporter [Bittarella massiliensis (ex Durand et al. 2017)]|uniref:MFS transporter n=1 Tax=Bittarella massiliensis (ex Durand et al. 2017) TaxID=1720313 RepID=UPI001AA11D53|nr:MFS transporter [Bittarella massiliensis (ex Durand et al. 2017)]